MSYYYYYYRLNYTTYLHEEKRYTEIKTFISIYIIIPITYI